MENSLFERYLISIGFKPYYYNLKSNSYIEITGNIHYSSFKNGERINSFLVVYYIKDDKKVIYGLHETHHPPTLIYPRPKIKEFIENPFGIYVNDKQVIDIHCDSVMDNIFIKYTPEEVYDSIFGDKILELGNL